MLKNILLAVLCVVAIPIIAFIIGKYASAGYFSAKEFMKKQKSRQK